MHVSKTTSVHLKVVQQRYSGVGGIFDNFFITNLLLHLLEMDFLNDRLLAKLRKRKLIASTAQ